MKLAEEFFAPSPPGGSAGEAHGAAWSNPGDLRMHTYVPADLPAGAPLVVVLHGCGQSAEALAIGASWLQLADLHGFALLCPEQKRANNFNTCFNWFAPEDSRRGGGEACSIVQMTQWILDNRALDPARVFVAGLSAGGAMTNVLLATYPDIYAAGGVIAGLPFAAARNMAEAFVAMQRGSVRSAGELAEAVLAARQGARWPKVSVWHGDADSTVAPSNASAIINQWTDARHISTPPLHEYLSGHERRRWLDSSGDIVLELNIVPGMNHAWPLATEGRDACGAPGPYLAAVNISASAELLRFWGIHAEQKAAAPKPEQLDRPLQLPRAAKRPPARDLEIAAPSAEQPQTDMLTPSAAEPDIGTTEPSIGKRGLAARLGGFLRRLLRKGFGHRH
ncbi:MAG: PHB depolymerase family esterase [Caulobacterales bacterium]